MYHDYTFEAVLASSMRAQWQLDDVLRADQELDFSYNFLPESLARSAAVKSLNPDEQRALNHISAHQYLWPFGVVEEFILPFVLDHARPMLSEDDYRIRALLNFAGEEAKHIHLFKRFHEAFVRGFPTTCAMIGPREKVAEVVLGRDPLAVGLTILMIEWMTQEHYLGSIRDSGDIEPLFKSLLKHHWMEEAQHAKLDTLIVDALAEGRNEQQIARAINHWVEIVAFLSRCLGIQASANVASLEGAIGRTIEQRQRVIAQQCQAARWTYLGIGMVHERFKAAVEAISPKAAASVAIVAARLAGPLSATNHERTISISLAR